MMNMDSEAIEVANGIVGQMAGTTSSRSCCPSVNEIYLNLNISRSLSLSKRTELNLGDDADHHFVIDHASPEVIQIY